MKVIDGGFLKDFAAVGFEVFFDFLQHVPAEWPWRQKGKFLRDHGLNLEEIQALRERRTVSIPATLGTNGFINVDSLDEAVGFIREAQLSGFYRHSMMAKLLERKAAQADKLTELNQLGGADEKN